ncbi:MAG: lytic transglycosylase domain-containing protein [Anaerovoracaceae bacterium]
MYLWLPFIVLLDYHKHSSISIYAEENIQGDFFIKDITINGEKIANNQLQYPFFLYKDTTYFPLTTEMLEICGIEADMNWESRTLKLMKKEPTRLNISERSFVNDYKDVKAEVLSDAKVFIYQLDKKESELTEDPSKEEKTTETDANDDAINDIIIKMPTLFAEEVDLEEYPVLAKDDIVYLPMRALVGEEGLGWDLYYDPYVGTYLSTQEEKNAKSYWEEAESKYNQGLVNYIKGCNKNYTTSRAQELVFMFKRAAEVYNIDEKILMAVAQRESTFNPKAKGGSGSLGMMQVMPATGRAYGLSTAQLLDAQTSINFGAMYLSNNINAYKGDLVKGFSAYNQGPSRVNRGSHSTRYATRVMSTMNNIDSYLTSNGYGSGN